MGIVKVIIGDVVLIWRVGVLFEHNKWAVVSLSLLLAVPIGNRIPILISSAHIYYPATNLVVYVRTSNYARFSVFEEDIHAIDNVLNITGIGLS